ncbi:hypothetical protein A6R68_24303, partial [Neotoma lepida]
MLDNWKQGDSPVEKHRQLYPSCSFVHTLLSASLPSPTKNTAPVRNKASPCTQDDKKRE